MVHRWALLIGTHRLPGHAVDIAAGDGQVLVLDDLAGPLVVGASSVSRGWRIVLPYLSVGR